MNSPGDGPSAYDPWARWIYDDTRAEAVALVVGGGRWGSGFAVVSNNIESVRLLSKALREAADQIDRDLQKAGH